MSAYTVLWAIEIDAASFEHAARLAFELQHSLTLRAMRFHIREHDTDDIAHVCIQVRDHPPTLNS